MASAEGKVFSDQQRRSKRLTLAVLIGAGCAIVALLFLLSPGNTFDVYTFGAPCVTDCGQQAGNALLCLEAEPGKAYCSRRCGETFPACPAGYVCQALDPGAAAAPSSKVTGNFCIRTGKPAAVLVDPAGQRTSVAVLGQDDDATLLSFESLTLQLPNAAARAAASRNPAP